MPSDNPFSRPVDFGKYCQEIVKEVKIEFDAMRKEFEGVVF